MTDVYDLVNVYDLYHHQDALRHKVASLLGLSPNHHHAAALPALRDAGQDVVHEFGAILAIAEAAWADRNDLEPEDARAVRVELHRIRARAEAQRIHAAEQGEAIDTTSRLVAGDAVLTEPDGTPAVWGVDAQVLWAEGEPLLLVAPTGAGKTTIGGQLVAGLIGAPQFRTVLEFPVTPRRRVLYVAADRPRQIIRALRRQVAHVDEQQLAGRLVIWRGPLPTDLGQQPEALLKLCRQVDADVVVLDSLKDIATKLTDDAVGANVNAAMQHCVAEGIDVLAMHHQRKGQAGNKPDTIADVYGSTWLVAGAGSVVLLWGAPGDAVIDLKHLKQPADAVGPLRIEHDHDAGRSTVFRGFFDPLAFLTNRGRTGATSAETARAWFETMKPTPNERMRALRALQRLERAGLAQVAKEASSGGSDGSQGARYVACVDASEATHAPTNAPLSAESTNEARTPRTEGQETAGQATNGGTNATNTAGHARTPLSLERGAAAGPLQGPLPGGEF